MNTTDPTQSDYAGPCPRCGNPVPNGGQPGEFPGALSRKDNRTYICSSCGSSEALYQLTRILDGHGVTLPPVNEPIMFGARA